MPCSSAVSAQFTRLNGACKENVKRRHVESRKALTLRDMDLNSEADALQEDLRLTSFKGLEAGDS